MTKNEILREFFGSRVISYYRLGESNTLIVELQELSWSDLTPSIIQCIGDIQAATSESISVSFEVEKWD